MKILFFISVHDNGVGGHFHSLNHISTKLAESYDVKIVTIGPGFSNAITTNPFFYKSIYFKYLDFFYLKREIDKIVEEFNPDIYHFFDIRCYNIIRIFLSAQKKKFIVTKCGGPNQKYDPYIDNLILFSIENYDWFSKRKKYKNSNIYLIPNRVKALMLEKGVHNILKDDCFTFVRVCRIGMSYKKSILDSFNLIEHLIFLGVENVRLVIIGSIESLILFEQLNNHKLVQRGSIQFFTDDIYTKEASKMLFIADAVIGTGRGFMESASLSIPLLTINSKGNIPVLINQTNFWDAFRTNFSERNIFSNYVEKENLVNIIELINNKIFYKQMSIFSKNLFDYYFNIDHVSSSYKEVYEKSVFSKKRHLFVDAVSIIRSIINITRHNIIYKRRSNK